MMRYVMVLGNKTVPVIYHNGYICVCVCVCACMRAVWFGGAMQSKKSTATCCYGVWQSHQGSHHRRHCYCWHGCWWFWCLSTDSKSIVMLLCLGFGLPKAVSNSDVFSWEFVERNQRETFQVCAILEICKALHISKTVRPLILLCACYAAMFTA